MNFIASHNSDRDLYGASELQRLINPRSIAIVGASETPGSFGLRTLDNIRIGYTGNVYPVNPRRDMVAGLTCFGSLEDLPEVPDCVVVCVPRENVVALAEQAAALGVGGMIIYTSGFAEVGTPDQISDQQRLVTIAQGSKLRILGPNCVGIANLVSRVGINFMPKFNEMPIITGGIGLISQSGGVGYCMLQALERGIGFSHYLSPGNSCDVDICDLINCLVEDPSTRVIGCTFEGIRDGRRFQEAAMRALAADKPLLIYKVADSEISRKTALSHTGTLAGASVAYRAAFDCSGVVVLENWEEMVETAGFFLKAGRPSAFGVGVMASSGGAAVMAADKAELRGLSLPAPSSHTTEMLSTIVPDFGSTANPADITAESLKSNNMYGDCIRAFSGDPSYGVVVVPMMSAHRPTTVERASYLCQLSRDLPKPTCLVWINEWLQGPGSEVYDSCGHLSVFRSMDRCMKAIKLWFRHYERRESLLIQTNSAPPPLAAVESVRSLMARRAIKNSLSESESKEVLAAYGVPVVRDELVSDIESALLAAQRIGFPVVLKVDSADIPHKTEAGVVRLNVADEKELYSAYTEILAAAAVFPGRPAINGVLVQKMIDSGVELMIGSRNDPQFGPLIMCGFGGIAVELTKDISVQLAPVNVAQAKAMILSLRSAPLLTGYRNTTPLDIDAFANAVCAVSQLAANHRKEIGEIDINPVILNTHNCIAVDALIVRNAREN